MTTATARAARPTTARSDGNPGGRRTDQFVDLYWLPLGAGGHSVRFNGKVFESIQAARGRRPRCALYHAALEVRSRDGRFVIEMTPIPKEIGTDRGVVTEGPVGSRSLRRFRLFRYELRRWRDGVIPDVDEAVSSPVRLTDDDSAISRLLALVPSVPTLVWGRDELRAGEMWTSNSIVSWLIARSGLDVESVQLPHRGRAPGWDAGVAVARREQEVQVDRALAAVRACASRAVASPASRAATREACATHRDVPIVHRNNRRRQQ